MSSLKEAFDKACVIMGEFRRIGYTQIEDIERYNNLNEFEIVLNERLAEHLEALMRSMKLNKHVADYYIGQIMRENVTMSAYLENRRMAPLLFLSRATLVNDEDVEVPVQSRIRSIAFSICNFFRSNRGRV